MKTLFLLIMLTQNGAGDISASFVDTDTLKRCQQKLLMIEGVFAGSNIPVIESRCIKSNMRFSEFNHATTSSATRNFYRIHFDEGSVEISKVSDWYSCMDQQRINPYRGGVYCSSSFQSFL